MNGESQTQKDLDEGRARGPSGSIGFALVLILIGAFFLARQFIGFEFHNWWALFILIPAVSSFRSAYRLWLRSGRFSFGVWSAFYGGLFPLLVAFMFLFDLDWGMYWPLFVILAGFGMLVNGLPFSRKGERSLPPALACHRNWALGIGLSATLLGLTFLGMNLDMITGLPFLDVENWWGVFILIPALGGLLTMVCLLIGGHSTLLSLINLAAAALVGFIGVVAMYDLDWKLINIATPILLILVGIGLIVGFGGEKGEDA